HRGIYEAVVYSSHVALEGAFAAPDWKALKIDPKDVLWEDAELTLAVPDLRGAKGTLSALLGGKSFTMLPGSKVPGYGSGVHAVVGSAAAEGARFALAMDLNGSGSIQFAPAGTRT